LQENVTFEGMFTLFVSLITGTRPQIVKSASVLVALQEAGIDHEFVHTGQHYDYEMAGAFIDGFGLESPTNLNIGPGDYCQQTYSILEKLSSHCQKRRPDYLVVPGDTTSALGAALVGFKMEIPVCHLESGLRRYDLRVQEEVNRRLIDHASSALFAPTETAVRNLESEDVPGTIYHIGDTMYDVLKDHLPRFIEASFRQSVLHRLRIETDEFAVLTLHRRENVDSRDVLSTIVAALNSLDFPIVFPIHPRTRKQIEEFGFKLDSSHIRVIDPLPYDDFMALVAGSKLTISDSGGIQKECYLLNVPLVSLHTRTEWVETVEKGANVLTDLTLDSIVANCQRMYGRRLSNDPSVYGDGAAAKRIPPILQSGEIAIPSDRRKAQPIARGRRGRNL